MSNENVKGKFTNKMEGRCKIRKNGEWSGKNEKIEFNGSIRRD